MKSSDLAEDNGYEPSKEEPKTGNELGTVEAPRKKKIKIAKEGQPCRKCNTPVIKRSPKKKTTKPNQSYYYAWYLYCPECRAMYMVEEAKRETATDGKRNATGDGAALF